MSSILTSGFLVPFTVHPNNCIDSVQNIGDGVQCIIDEQQGQPCE